MRAVYVAEAKLEELLDPHAAAWKSAKGEVVKMVGTPIGLQPTALIRNAWINKKIGQASQVSVAAIHNGEFIAFRLEWADASENKSNGDNSVFPDGAAIALPAGDAKSVPIMTMGAPGAAVNAWYWRADQNGVGRHVVAEGIGTSRTVDQELVKANGVWANGHWQVVIVRALAVESKEPLAQLMPGQATGFGVAIWEGNAGERGGIKAFSGDWLALEVDGH